MTTIHLILNSHIDPVWLWPWQSGLDMILGTFRSACERLDRHPDIVFTFGGAWALHKVEQTDPRLFERIRRHVLAGRWEIAGGWWVEPDCNLPSPWAMQKQIELGRRFLEDRFGQFPRVGCNIDSFGHAASLPAILRSGGQDRYVMMRPGPQEMSLPARLFRWRGEPDGPEVVTFRIANGYNARPPMDQRLEHIRASLTDLPDGIRDTMCFIGVGDHGGGVTDRMITWCREHQDAFDGARLTFSSPGRFFDAVAGQLAHLPLVVGELQPHAVGCYSVYRPIKTAMRRAEHLLRQAEIAHRRDPAPEPDWPLRSQRAWERVCFGAFHDTLCGTCIPSAYAQIEAQLGEAIAFADESLHLSLRRQMAALPDDPLQRIVAFNASDQPFDGYVEFEPWREYSISVPALELQEESGSPGRVASGDRAVPYQRLTPEAVAGFGMRLLFRCRMEPQELRVLRVKTDCPSPAPPTLRTALTAQNGRLAGDCGLAVSLAPRGERILLLSPAMPLDLPQLALVEDASDTWSHGITHYADSPSQEPLWEAPEVVEDGPLRTAMQQRGKIGDSLLRAEWRLYAGEGFVELVLDVDWRERHKVLKWVLTPPRPVTRRTDGVLGGQLVRPCDLAERPVRDWSLLELEGGGRVGVVCPDAYGLDCTPSRLRLTLLRSAIMAHHVPHSGVHPRPVISDRGVHTFRFRLFGGNLAEAQTLDWHALMMQRPLVLADLTRGMPSQVDDGVYNKA